MILANVEVSLVEFDDTMGEVWFDGYRTDGGLVEVFEVSLMVEVVASDEMLVEVWYDGSVFEKNPMTQVVECFLNDQPALFRNGTISQLFPDIGSPDVVEETIFVFSKQTCPNVVGVSVLFAKRF